jgi:hypothetical protein
MSTAKHLPALQRIVVASSSASNSPPKEKERGRKKKATHTNNNNNLQDHNPSFHFISYESSMNKVGNICSEVGGSMKTQNQCTSVPFILHYTSHSKANMTPENTYCKHKHASRRKKKHVSLAGTLFAQHFVQ